MNLTPVASQASHAQHRPAFSRRLPDGLTVIDRFICYKYVYDIDIILAHSRSFVLSLYLTQVRMAARAQGAHPDLL